MEFDKVFFVVFVFCFCFVLFFVFFFLFLFFFCCGVSKGEKISFKKCFFKRQSETRKRLGVPEPTVDLSMTFTAQKAATGSGI